MKKTGIVLLSLAVLFLSGCATTNPSTSQSQKEKGSSEQTEKKTLENRDGPVTFEPEAEPIVCKVTDKNCSLTSFDANKTYRFQIKSKHSYCIVMTKNDSIYDWNVFENDGSNDYSGLVRIPLDGKMLNIAFSESRNRIENVNYTIKINAPEVKSKFITDYDDYSKLVVGDKRALTCEEKLQANRFYEINVAPSDKQYCIISFIKGKESTWQVMEKNEKGSFYAVVQVPVDAEKMVIAYSDKDNYYANSYTDFKVEPANVAAKTNKIDDYYEINLDKRYVGTYPEKIYDGQFYNFVMGRNVGQNYVLNFNDKQDKLLLWESIPVNEAAECSKKIYVSKGTKKLKMWIQNGPNDFTGYGEIEVIPSKQPYVFESGYDSSKVNKYKNNKPDEKIIAYLDSIDARSIGKTDPDGMIQSCVEKINEYTNDDFLKVKMIHDMCWYLLSYDNDSFLNDSVPNQDYVSVLKSGLSVCAGFGNLFYEICRQAGVECFLLNGYARGGFGAKVWQPTDDPTVTNHAWNMVKLYGQWYIVDATWDSSQTEGGKSNNFYTSAWLFIDPELFIHSHFTTNGDFQLLKKPVTAEEFKKLPFKRP